MKKLWSVLCSFARTWPPYADKMLEMQEGRRSLADSLRTAFEIMLSSCIDDIMECMAAVVLRPGLFDLPDLAADLSLAVVVIAGGLSVYVEKKLEAFDDRLLAIHSVDVDLSGGNIKIYSPCEADGEMI